MKNRWLINWRWGRVFRRWRWRRPRRLLGLSLWHRGVGSHLRRHLVCPQLWTQLVRLNLRSLVHLHSWHLLICRSRGEDSIGLSRFDGAECLQVLIGLHLRRE